VAATELGAADSVAGGIDVTAGAGLSAATHASLGWGAGFFDYENDGDADNADLLQVRNRRTVEFKGY